MTDLIRTVVAGSIVGVSVLLPACASDKPVAPPPPAITSLQLSAATVTVPKGSTRNLLAVIGRSLDFKGTVTLSVEGAPAGMSAAFTPPTLGNTDVQSLLNITASSAAQPGTYNLTARASAMQVDSRTIPVTVVVTEPGMSLSVPATASVVQAGTTTIPLSVARTGGFDGAVTVFAQGLPTGVTASFAPSTLGGATGESTLTLTASPTASAGTFSMSVRASAAGLEAITQPLTVTVALAATPSVVLTSDPAAIFVRNSASSGEATITIGRSGGYSGAVTLSLEGLPAAATATFTPVTTAGNSSVLRIETAGGLSLGGTNLTVRATGAGIPDATRVVVLQVQQAPTMTLTLSHSQMTLKAGTSGTNGLFIQRQGGAGGSVTLTAVGVPQGVTHTILATIPGSAALGFGFDVSVNSMVAPGTYPITIRGVVSESGLQAETVLTLIVEP